MLFSLLGSVVEIGCVVTFLERGKLPFSVLHVIRLFCFAVAKNNLAIRTIIVVYSPLQTCLS